MQTQRKANLIIIRGRKVAAGRFGQPYPEEIRGENWDNLQHRAYTEMIPLYEVGTASVFQVVALVPGEEPIVSEGVFYRGCNALAITPEIGEVL